MKTNIILLSIFLIHGLIYTEAKTGDSILVSLDNKWLIEADGYIYVKAEEDIDSSKSFNEGLKKAIEKAKEKILQFKGERAVSLLFSQKIFDNLKENQIFQSSVSSRSEGYITEFTILTNTRKLIANDEYTRISIYTKAKYEKIKGAQEPLFNLTVKLNKRIFLNGDNMTLQAQSGLNGYLTVYCIDEIGKTYLLFPNSINSDNTILANTPLQLPTKKEIEATASYRMFLTEGQKESLEFLRVMITLEPFSTAKIENIDDFPGQFVKIERDKIEYIDIGYKIIAK